MRWVAWGWLRPRPGVMTHGPVVWVTDGALLATGIGLITRQPDRWTGPLCLGFMTSKALILTLAVVTVGVTTRVPWVLTLLILVLHDGCVGCGQGLAAGGGRDGGRIS